MNHIRWSDDDHYFGPFTYCKDKYKNFAVVLGSGDEDYPGCRIRFSGLGYTLISALPPIIRPWKNKVFLSTSVAKAVGCPEHDYYWDIHEREYGFSYGHSGAVGDGGFIQVFFGRQTHDSSTTQSWSCFTPWNNWRHVRRSLYGLDGEHVYTEPERRHLRRANKSDDRIWADTWRVYHEEVRQAEDACPTRTFSFKDFDGEELTAKTRIEEREWRFGTKWFKWLAYFRKPIIHRSLDIEFSGETGHRKGSWKGGTIGHSIEMLSGELHEAAFRRYCEKHEMTFGGEVQKVVDNGVSV